MNRHLAALAGLGALALTTPATAQVDSARAGGWFSEIETICRRDGGRLWGVSLCGPMVLADAATRTIAANQPPPEGARPRSLGFANTALDWGGTRWSAIVWQFVPADDAPARNRLLLHEAFHRVQPDLNLLIRSATPPDHLDTMDGRYWMQLEWRALARALGASGSQRRAAVADALAFRQRRHALEAEAAESERVIEINEGLAQYTGTVLAAGSRADAIRSAIEQLQRAPERESFVRTAGYPIGLAYGLLLDEWSPGWPRRVRIADDLGGMVMAAAGITPTSDAETAARRYDADALRAAEELREADRQARVAELRRRFVEGPVLVMPRGRGASFITTGITPIPDVGTVYPSFRVSGEWGSIEAEQVLMSPDGSTLTVPGPPVVEGRRMSGPGWTIALADGWTAEPGPREGDFRLARRAP